MNALTRLGAALGHLSERDDGGHGIRALPRIRLPRARRIRRWHRPGHPDNVITETRVVAEFKRHGIRSRVGRHRADLVHQPMSFLGFAVPALLAVGTVYMLTRGGGASSRRPPSIRPAWRVGAREPRNREGRVQAPSTADGSRRYDTNGAPDEAGVGRDQSPAEGV